MKSEKLRREESSLENIVEALKSVPKKQLRIVRDAHCGARSTCGFQQRQN